MNQLAFLLTLFTFTSVAYTQSLSASLNVVTTTINTLSNYQFTIIDDTLATSSGSISLIFPSTKFTNSSFSSPTCFSTTNSAITYPCSLQNSSLIRITYTNSGSSLLLVTVSNIKNPSSVATSTFTYQYGSNSFSFTYSGYTTASFTSCSITYAPNTLNQIGEAQFTITLQNAVTTSGSLYIKYPTIWPDTAGTTTPIPTTDSRTYRKISGTSLPSSFTITNISVALQSIELPSLFIADASANSTISFGVPNLLSPPTGSSSNSITITTRNSNGEDIDSSSCLVTSPLPQSISLTNTSSFVLGVSSSMSVSWTTACPLKNGDTISVVLPSNMDYVNLSTVIILRYGSSGLATLQVSNGGSTSQRIFTIQPTPTSAIISTGSAISFTISSITTLINSASRSVSISVKRGTNTISSGQLTVTTIPNTLSNVSIISSTATVLQSTSYTITFTTINNLQSSSFIQIVIPSEIPISSTTSACSVTSANNTSINTASPNCTFANRTLTIQGYLQSILAGGSTLSVTIPNLTNPQTTLPTSPFQIFTYYSSTFNIDKVDQSTTATYTASPASIGIASVSCGNTTVGAISTCTISYTIQSVLLTNSLITISYPTQLALTTTTSYSYSINNATSQTTNPTVTGNMINYTNILTSNLNSGSTITFTITNMRNPLSLKPSSTFKIYSYSTSYSYLQQSIISSLIITPLSMNNFKTIFKDAPNYINNNPTLYTINIQLSVGLAIGDKIIIALASGTNQMQFTSTLKCSINNAIIPCTKNNRQLTITLNQALTSASPYAILVDSIILGRSLLASPSITVTTYTSDGYGISQQSLTNLANTRTQSVRAISLSIIQSPSQLNQFQSFTINMNLTVPLISTDYIILTIPSIYKYTPASLQTTSICTNINTTCLHYNSQTNLIKIQSSFINTQIFSITIRDNLYLSPTTFNYNKQDYFTITTYDTSNFSIETTDTTISTTKATFYTTCSANCKTCDATTAAVCLSCYATGDGQTANVTFDGPFFIRSDSKCVTACGSGFFNNTASCSACVAPCSDCTSIVDCTTCLTNFSYQSSSKRCVNPCPAGTYSTGSPSVCQSCQLPCLTCITLATTCLSCNGTLLLSSNQCVASCPLGTFQLSQACVACHASCIACSLASTNCSSCSSGYYAVNASSSFTQCTNICPTGTVNTTTASGWNCTCAPQCLTCSITISNCNTCDASGIYPWKTSNGQSCVSSCTPGTYANVGLKQCLECPQANCKLCNSTTCTQCSNTTYLFQGACVSVCPSRSILVSSECVSCPTGCKSCSTTTICTQCQFNYLKEETTCVSVCSSNYINFNSTVCLTSCPIGYLNTTVDGIHKCISNGTNNTDSNSNTTTTLVQSKIIPFPFIIGYAIVWAVGIASRVAVEWTVLPAIIVSLGGVIEVASWITLLLLEITTLQRITLAALIVLSAIVINMVLNVVCLVLMRKYVQKDDNYKRSNTKTICTSNIIKGISVGISHKMINILFSGMFAMRMFSRKVTKTAVLLPLNILLYASILPSILAIAGGGISNFNVQNIGINNSLYIQSLDLIIVCLLNIIVTVWVTVRSQKLYTKDKQSKSYDTQEEFNNGSEGMDGVLNMEGVDKIANQMYPDNNDDYKKGEYSKMYDQMERGFHERPLQKRQRKGPLSDRQQKQQKSSQALVFENKQSDSQAHVEESQGDQANPIRQLISPIRIKSKFDPASNEISDNDIINQLKSHRIIDQNSEQFMKLSPEQQQKVKQNNQILKSQLKNNYKHPMSQTSIIYKKSPNKNNQSEQLEVQNILLSPKKKSKNSKSKDKLNKDKSPKDKNKNKSESLQAKDKKKKQQTVAQRKSLEKSKQGQTGEDGEKPNEKLQRISSEGFNKIKKIKSGKNNQIKSSKNISSINPNRDTELYVLFNNDDSKPRYERSEQIFQDQPQLPVFKPSRKQNKYGTEMDALEIIQESAMEQKQKEIIKNRNNALKSQKFKRTSGFNEQIARRGSNNVSSFDLPQMKSTQNLNSAIKSHQNQIFKKIKNTQNMPQSTKMGQKNHQIQDIQSLNSNSGPNLFQEVSPSLYNFQNRRFHNDQSSYQIPQKPIVKYQSNKEDQQFQQNYQINNQPIQSHLAYNKFASESSIDYDSVLTKKIRNDRITDLQKIYLPRLQVRKYNSKNK